MGQLSLNSGTSAITRRRLEMGVSPREEDIIKEEMRILLEGLKPEEADKLRRIRDSVLDRGDWSHQVSYRSARTDACGVITHAVIASKSVDAMVEAAQCKAEGRPTPLDEAVRKACDDLREKILDNPTFEVYA
jgi:hypothetical protein